MRMIIKIKFSFSISFFMFTLTKRRHITSIFVEFIHTFNEINSLKHALILYLYIQKSEFNFSNSYSEFL